MTVDVNALDLLPAEAKGLWPCWETCRGLTCEFVSCQCSCAD
ncbi:ALQxL family class IV lanthipeptide [Nonomuraea sp. NPDC048826]